MGHQKKVTYKALGLYTYPNQFGAPDGAMSTASDVFIDRPGVVESARTFTDTQALTSAGTGVNWFFPLPTTSAANQGLATSNASTSTPPYIKQLTTHLYDISGPTEYFLNTVAASTSAFAYNIYSEFGGQGYAYIACGGTISPSSSSITGSGQAGIAANFTVPTVDSITTDGRLIRSRGCGMPEAPVPVYYTGTSGSGITSLPNTATFTYPVWGDNTLTATNNRAYRVLFLRKDANGQLIRGAPSGRLIVGNFGGGGGDFGLIIFGVNRLYAGDLIQLYASEVSAYDSAVPTEPSDDMRLVYEYSVVQGDVTAKYITIEDITPDANRGAALYTDDYQEGILMAEQAPPSAAFTSWFKSVAWYGGIFSRGNTQTVVNVIGLDGWAVTTTTWTINSLTYTAKAAEDVTARQFKLYTAGSVAQNLQNTVQSMCRCICYADTSSLAIYATPPNATAATFILKFFGGAVNSAQIPGTTTITTTAPAGTFAPAGTLTTTEPSKPNFLYFSKPNQPEAVPDINYVRVGSPSSAFAGMAHVRDSLFIFKTEGLFRVTGTTGNDIRVELFDETVKSYPWQYRTIASGGNQIFAMCSQGIVSVTESGVNIVSRQIDDLIAPYYSVSYDPFGGTNGTGRLSAIACASDSEKKYFLLLNTPPVSGTSATGPLYCYNFINQSWTQITNPTGTVGITSAARAGVMASNPYWQTSDQVVICDMKHATYGRRLYYIGETSPVYAATPTFQYCFTDQFNPGTLRRYSNLKITTYGSGSFTSCTVTFNSDSGASPEAITVTPYDSLVLTVQVPKSHALCTELYASIAFTTGGNLVDVSSVQLAYEEAGDWNVK